MEVCKIFIRGNEPVAAMNMAGILTGMGHILLPDALGYNVEVAVPDSHKPVLSV
jgi:hypothetical protein